MIKQFDTCISITKEQYYYLLPTKKMCNINISEANGKYYFYFAQSQKINELADFYARLLYLEKE